MLLTEQPLRSMTGFASLMGSRQEIGWQWEIRSVNGRGLDIRVRLPEGAEVLDPKLRAAAKPFVSRGNVTVSLRRKTAGQPGALPGKENLAEAAKLLSAAEQAAQDAQLAPRSVTAADVATLALSLGVGGETNLWISEAEAQISDLVRAFLEVREQEGHALGELLSADLIKLEALTTQAETLAKERSKTWAGSLKAKVSAVLSDMSALDENRLEQELAIMIVKADVTEEIDRLRTHITAAHTLLQKGGAVGRKFDFLMQEFNREANTLCSKSSDADLTAVGLELKVVIDRMREQVQNLE